MNGSYRCLMLAFSVLLASAVDALVNPAKAIEQEVTDPVGTSASFGDAIAVTTEGLALIGAPADLRGASGSPQGKVFAYQKIAGSWVLTQTILCPENVPPPQFGHAIAIDGNTAVIGANTYSDPQTNDAIGRAYVYTYASGTWTLSATLSAAAPVPQDLFGNAVAIQDGTIMVGAPRAYIPGGQHGPGSVFVFTRAANGTWSQSQALTASNGQVKDEFGYAVSFSRGYAIIGAPKLLAASPGAVYVFRLTSGAWVETYELLSPNSFASDDFGASVAIRAGLAVVGAPAVEVSSNSEQGAAYVLELIGSTWTETQTLTTALGQGAPRDHFGASVDIDGTKLIVGRPRDSTQQGMTYQGTAQVYAEAPDGTFVSTEGLVAAHGAAQNHFGAAVAFAKSATNSLNRPSGEPFEVAIGAPNTQDASGNVTGAVYFYDGL